MLYKYKAQAMPTGHKKVDFGAGHCSSFNQTWRYEKNKACAVENKESWVSFGKCLLSETMPRPNQA
jgi:hypothetical protein